MNQFAAYVPIDRRRAMANRQTLSDRTSGGALFADISGFTPLTEALATELGPQRGAEELTRTLNQVYNGLIAAVHTYNGSVIGFAGDAITCWFDGDDGHRAVACALTMQSLMARYGEVSTPGGKIVQLAIKTAVAAGPTRRFMLGDPSIQLFDVLAGDTLTRMAAAEQRAERNELIVSSEVMDALGGLLEIAEVHQNELGQTFGVVAGLIRQPEFVSQPTSMAILNEAELRSWVLPPVYTRLLTGQGNYLAELRPAATIFLYFDGLQYDEDPDAGHKLNQFIRWVQNVLNRHEGYLLQLIMGDKGSYLYASFGAPVAHGDDPLRAVAAALELKELPKFLSYIKNVKAGISYGRVRTGAYGSEIRKTYGVIGDTVNVSARLMQKAQPGQILVSEQIFSRVRQRSIYRELGSISLKGKSEPMSVTEVVSLNTLTSLPQSQLAKNHDVFGRQNELALAGNLLKLTDQKQGQILLLEGAVGIGKTHLSQVIVQQAEADHHFQIAQSACFSTGRSAAYAPWQTIIRLLFDLDLDPHNPESVPHQIQSLTRQLRRMNESWELRLPLLGDILGLPIADNATTAAFSAEQRQEALHALIIDILSSKSLDRPLLLFVDDAHWLDEGSAALIEDLSRTIAHRPIFLLLSRRPPYQSQSSVSGLSELNHYQKVILTELSAKHIQRIVEKKLEGVLAPLAAELIQNQAQGNPFFAEEMVKSMVEQDQLVQVDRQSRQQWELAPRVFDALTATQCLYKEDFEWRLRDEITYSPADLGLPDSVHGAVLSRLDNLNQNEQLTVKVASVIGRLFEFDILQQVHPGRPEVPDLMTQVTGVENREFVQLETIDPTLNYMFRHNTVQEVAYDTLLFAQRRELHQTIATWYETTFPEESVQAAFYPLLAYHWRYAEDPEKERYYVIRAGQQAAAKFANQDAIRFLDRGLALVPQDAIRDRFQILLDRQAIYAHVGDRDAQRQDLDDLELLIDQLNSEVSRHQYFLVKSDFHLAIGEFRDALLFARATYDISELNQMPAGQIEAMTNIGIIEWQMGQFSQAIDSLNLALILGQQNSLPTNRAVILRNLGIVYGITNQFDQAQKYFAQALEVDRVTQNKIGEDATISNMAGVYFQIGDLAQSRKLAADSLALNREIGLRRGETSALINLGSVSHALGDLKAAAMLFTDAIELAQQINDPIHESMASYNLALVLVDQEQFDQAQMMAEKASTIDRALDDQLSLSYSLYVQGLAQFGLDKYSDASEKLAQAADIRHELEMPESIIDCLAARALSLMGQSEVEQAVEHVTRVTDWLDQNGEVGIENPARVYTAVVQVMAEANHREIAEQWLERGKAFIQTRAASISEDEAREAYINRTPCNRELMQIDLSNFSKNQPAS